MKWKSTKGDLVPNAGFSWMPVVLAWRVKHQLRYCVAEDSKPAQLAEISVVIAMRLYFTPHPYSKRTTGFRLISSQFVIHRDQDLNSNLQYIHLISYGYCWCFTFTLEFLVLPAALSVRSFSRLERKNCKFQSKLETKNYCWSQNRTNCHFKNLFFLTFPRRSGLFTHFFKILVFKFDANGHYTIYILLLARFS